MIADRPVLSFDTSTYNRLLDDGAERSEAIFAGLKSGYFVRNVGLAFEEMLAASDASERAALLACAHRLQHGPSDCIHAHNELLRLLIMAHKAAPESFDWRSVNVSGMVYIEGLVQDLIADDALSAEQRNDLKLRKKEFEAPFSKLRSKVEEIFERHGESHPMTFQEVLPRIREDGGLVWGFARGLYSWAAGTAISEPGIRQFMDACPPFRAMVYALLLAWYDRSVRERHTAEKFRAGRLDLFMAVYLPYCDRFITAETYGEQERCLREVARAASLNTEVGSYDDFCSGMLVTV